MTPILLLGAGRMGGALIEGWTRAEAFSLSDLMVRDPAPGAHLSDGDLLLNPAEADLGRAKTVLLAVKPQIWRSVAAEVEPHLARDAIIVSIAAGVTTSALGQAFNGRRIARVMPTTAAAIGQGTASIYAADPTARARAHALFSSVGAVIDLADEELMHAATAVSGSSPAYLYAFVEALEAAGIAAGLTPAASARLARAPIAGAAALMAAGDTPPAELRRNVTSPGGTTQAALEVLMGEGGLEPLLKEAVAAAARRSKELGA
ncbi:MAG: pyrroline-5-carboxylate reductase [Caulobacteraceae bacterium]|nr:pyrroline-5-carboxylate reductase [Caulobacteraceae bacterium]